MASEYITKAHYPDGGCQCEGGGCSACDAQSDELQFASMKEIEEFYNVNGEALHLDPAEMDLEDMIQQMIDSEIDFDKEFRPSDE
jgi:hypothetical protein